MKKREKVKAIVDEVMLNVNAITDDYRERHLEEDEEELSECCTAPIIYHDICSACREHI